MRLFIAIELSADARKYAAEQCTRLQNTALSGRFTTRENLHVTLHFLGESNDLAGAAAAMRRAVSGIRPFNLYVGGYAAFEHTERKTAILRVGGDLGELNILHQSLAAALRDAGFSVERRRYEPHITLGRSVSGDGEMTADERGPEFTVRSITLFESLRLRDRLIYQPLHRERF